MSSFNSPGCRSSCGVGGSKDKMPKPKVFVPWGLHGLLEVFGVPFFYLESGEVGQNLRFG